MTRLSVPLSEVRNSNHTYEWRVEKSVFIHDLFIYLFIVYAAHYYTLYLNITSGAAEAN